MAIVAHPLPSSPVKGEVWHPAWGNMLPPPPFGTSPTMGEVGRGWLGRAGETGHHRFIPVVAMPSMSSRWKARKKTKIGTRLRTLIANSPP